jgi:hypothetical protein
MRDTSPPESVAGSELVSSSLLTALILSLINRGVLTPQDAIDALLVIEKQQQIGARSRRPTHLRSGSEINRCTPKVGIENLAGTSRRVQVPPARNSGTNQLLS